MVRRSEAFAPCDLARFAWPARCNALVSMKTLGSILLGLGILGSSASAFAGPHDRIQRFDRVERHDRADRFDRGRDVYRPSTSWQALTSVERLGRRNDVFDVRGRFAQLRLQNQTGRTYVRSIEVQFTDGSRQRMRVNRTLDGNHAMVNLQLDGSRRLDRIFVDGYSERGGSIQLYAM